MKKAKKIFYNYVQSYNLNNQMINYKYHHSLRVSDLSVKISQSLNLAKEQINLSALIGLLHDIGRFDQWKKFQSFNDFKTFDHGDYAVWLLFTNNLIRDYLHETKNDELIKKAIKAHNKKVIPKYYTEEEKLYSKIIRDADKIDILTAYGGYFKRTMDQEYSKEVLNLIKERKTIDTKQTKTTVDDLLVKFAFIYDINFNYSLKYIYNNDLLGKIINNIQFNDLKIKELLEELKEEIYLYIKLKEEDKNEEKV